MRRKEGKTIKATVKRKATERTEAIRSLGKRKPNTEQGSEHSDLTPSQNKRKKQRSQRTWWISQSNQAKFKKQAKSLSWTTSSSGESTVHLLLP